MEQVELTPSDASDLVALYEDYEWWEDRTVPKVRSALSNTPVAVGLRDDGDLVAAARVITDSVHYAKAYDVIVAADRRGEGVGTRLMEAVVSHSDLDGLNVELTCREGLIRFYEEAGFEEYDVTTDIAGEREPFVQMAYWRNSPNDA